MTGFEIYIELILISLISISAYILNILSVTGIIAAFPIGVITLIGGGPEWFILLLYFLLVGGILTVIRHKIKGSILNNDDIKGRSWVNVMSNGLIPTIACGLSIFTFDVEIKKTLFIFYLGSISSVFSDTASTEVGLLYPGYPRLITKPKIKVPPGFSGGVTPLGFLAGFIASLSISLVAFPGSQLLGISSRVVIIISVISGFLGSIIDSILGATVQAIYKCRKCGRLVEQRTHCGLKAELYKGFTAIDNNIVNFLTSLIGGLIAVTLLQIL